MLPSPPTLHSIFLEPIDTKVFSRFLLGFIYLDFCSTQDTIITQAELVSIQGVIGTNVQINSLYGLRFSGQAGFASPQRIEHIYEVNTQGTFNGASLIAIQI